jgi:hypothetical protein
LNPPPRHAARYAVYFAPAADHPLWRAGCTWLGRDPSADAHERPTRAHVDAPWRYGFHATLKAPMRLADGAAEAGFVSELERLARRTRAFAMPALEVAWLGGFLALRPRAAPAADHPLNRLARACVIELDHWRAAPVPAELARRGLDDLDADQRALLQRYGYPHVLERWRFHLTLSDKLARDAVAGMRLEREAGEHFAAALAEPLVCDSISLFVERAAGAPFQLARRCEFGAQGEPPTS